MNDKINSDIEFSSARQKESQINKYTKANKEREIYNKSIKQKYDTNKYFTRCSVKSKDLLSNSGLNILENS